MERWAGCVSNRETALVLGEFMRLRIFVILLAIACFGTARSALAQKPASPAAKAVAAASADVLLDGGDWRMGSFPFDAGVKAGAAQDSFDDSAFRTVTVPGDTQLQAGFTGVSGFRESAGLMEVNARAWWYRKHFRAPAVAATSITRLVFDGSDYFTTVWLNGQLLGTHEGGFVGFSFDVTKLLRPGADNLLAVEVAHPWVPKGRAVDEYIDGDFSIATSTRLKNPPYHVGITWDGLAAQGNASIPMGIWRSVHLRATPPVTIADLHVVTRSIEADGSATLHLAVTVDNASTQPQSRKVEFQLKPGNFSGAPIEIPALTVNASPGSTTVETDVRVTSAKLWWSWDHGPQNLYDLKATLAPQNALAASERSLRFGIRTVSRDADMAYSVNGKKLFAKASWFPIEKFYRSTATREDYERDLRMFRDANFNLLVNFTVVEKPEFYDLCDELGILVIEELPFPQFGPGHVLDMDGPRREPFLKQARLQVAQIVTANRNHPSIIQWTPLAEAHDEEMGKWSSYAPEGSWAVDQQGYDSFMAEMKQIVTDLAPGAVFHPSLCDLGEKHFWIGSDWDPRNYTAMFDAQANFISEYGGISISSFENLDKYLSPDEQWASQPGGAQAWPGLPIDQNAYAYWTANMNGGLTRMIFHARHYVDSQPRSARELAQATQLYQAFLLRYSAEAFRRKKYEPINGIRSWDYQEIAPGFRFAIVDFDRVPKTAYWYMKHAQAPVAISFAYKEALESQLAGSQWSAPVWVVNDLDREVRGTLHAELLTLAGQNIASADYPVTVAADGKTIAGNFSLTLPQDPGVYILRATLPAQSKGAEPVQETSFIKVVPAAFKGSHRVLLLALSRQAAPIAAMLRSMGLDVDIYDENSTDAMARDLADSARLEVRYDAIWLGSFEYLAKMLPAEVAQAIEATVKAGSGFVVTGGEGSFHGGNGRAALVEATALNQVLPVDTLGREDLIYPPHQADDTPQTRHTFNSIAPVASEFAPATGFSPQTLELLQRNGLAAYNRVSPRMGSKTQLSVAGQPLLVTGTYSAGRTVAFTGFTPEASEASKEPIDQYLADDPQARAYFSIFADLMADVLPAQQPPEPDLLAAHEKPLFQTLKEQPQTELAVIRIEAAPPSARLRVRIANHGGYAHLVHLRIEWAGSGVKPYLTELNDNDFELMPGESRDIAIDWRSAGSTRVGGTLIVDAANAPEARLSF
jgi:beta-mannosidase